jgi:hypothetical protein
MNEKITQAISLMNSLDVDFETLMTERDSLVTEKTALLATVSDLQGQLAAANTRIVQLQAEIERLKNPDAWDYYISPTGTGDGTKANPASITTLDAAISKVGPGGRVGLLKGNYSASAINLAHGGTADKPVLIACVDGVATFTGIRNNGVADFDSKRDIGDGTTIWKRPWVLPVSREGWQPVNSSTWGNRGAELFRLNAGASFLTFRKIDVIRYSRAWALYGDGLAGIIIEDCNGYNNQDHVYQNYVAPAGCKNLTIRRCTFVGYSKSAIRFNGASDGLLVEDVLGDSGWQVGDRFAMGFFVSDVAKNIVARRVTMRNSLDVQSLNDGNYWNADGFVAENGNTNLLYEDCIAEGCSDAGFDVKSRGVKFLRCISRRNKKNWRIWGDAILDACVSEAPQKAAIINVNLKGGNSGSYHIEMVGGQNTEDMTKLTLRNCNISVYQHKPDGVTTFFGTIVR